MAPSHFIGARRDAMKALQPGWRQAREDGRLKKWTAEAFQTYIKQFPEDDEETPRFERQKTKTGKTSLVRPEGVKKPIRERFTEFFYNAERAYRRSQEQTAQDQVNESLTKAARKKSLVNIFRLGFEKLIFADDTYEDYVVECEARGEEPEIKVVWRNATVRKAFKAASPVIRAAVDVMKQLLDSGYQLFDSVPNNIFEERVHDLAGELELLLARTLQRYLHDELFSADAQGNDTELLTPLLVEEYLEVVKAARAIAYGLARDKAEEIAAEEADAEEDAETLQDAADSIAAASGATASLATGGSAPAKGVDGEEVTVEGGAVESDTMPNGAAASAVSGAIAPGADTGAPSTDTGAPGANASGGPTDGTGVGESDPMAGYQGDDGDDDDHDHTLMEHDVIIGLSKKVGKKTHSDAVTILRCLYGLQESARDRALRAIPHNIECLVRGVVQALGMSIVVMVGGPDRDGVLHTDSWHGGPDDEKTFVSFDQDFFYGKVMDGFNRSLNAMFPDTEAMFKPPPKNVKVLNVKDGAEATTLDSPDEPQKKKRKRKSLGVSQPAKKAKTVKTKTATATKKSATKKPANKSKTVAVGTKNTPLKASSAPKRGKGKNKATASDEEDAQLTDWEEDEEEELDLGSDESPSSEEDERTLEEKQRSIERRLARKAFGVAEDGSGAEMDVDVQEKRASTSTHPSATASTRPRARPVVKPRLLDEPGPAGASAGTSKNSTATSPYTFPEPRVQQQPPAPDQELAGTQQQLAQQQPIAPLAPAEQPIQQQLAQQPPAQQPPVQQQPAQQPTQQLSIQHPLAQHPPAQQQQAQQHAQPLTQQPAQQQPAQPLAQQPAQQQPAQQQPDQEIVPPAGAQVQAPATPAASLSEFLSNPLDEILAFVENASVEKSAEKTALVNVTRAISGASEDESWLVLMKLSVMHEMILDFPAALDRQHKVTTAARPAEVKYWLDRGRKLDKFPPIKDVRSYGDAMRAWYTNIMPLWRRQSSMSWPLSRAKGEGDDWQQAQRGGVNGLAIIVIALTWWVQAADNENTLAEAESLCEDLVYVLTDMYRETVVPQIHLL